MPNDIGLLLIGIAMLYFGGDFLVAGCIRIANHFKVSPFIIGATVIGFGTSAPELAVSVFASLKDSSEVALGNAIGSNIANICLVLGLTSIFGPMGVSARIFKKETPSLLFVTVFIALLAWDYEVSRIEGGILLGLMASYLWLAFTKTNETQLYYTEVESGGGLFVKMGMKAQILLVGMGLVVLVLGAHLLVTGAVSIARSYGISEWVIGITVVAIGTSLPEIVSSLIAANRGYHEMSIGNIFGSNIFNINLVVGTASIIHPLQIKEAIHSDLAISTFLTFLLIFLIRPKLTLFPFHGVLLLICYVSYMIAKFQQIL